MKREIRRPFMRRERLTILRRITSRAIRSGIARRPSEKHVAESRRIAEQLREKLGLKIASLPAMQRQLCQVSLNERIAAFVAGSVPRQDLAFHFRPVDMMSPVMRIFP